MARTRGAAAMPRPLFRPRQARPLPLGEAIVRPPWEKRRLAAFESAGRSGVSPLLSLLGEAASRRFRHRRDRYRLRIGASRARERPSDSRNSFPALACGRRVFGSAWPCAKHCSSFGARTGRALQNCCAQAKGEANALSMVGEPGVRFAKGRTTCGSTIGMV